MAANINLMPNEVVVLKEVSVAHGGIMASYKDELILTNLNLIYIDKGIFGNTKNIVKYPLKQIKIYNGKAQVLQGALSNGIPALEVYFINGMETFYFQTQNKKNINKWMGAIQNTINGNTSEYSQPEEAGALDVFKEVGDQFKEVGQQFLDTFNLKMPNKKEKLLKEEKTSKKCSSCSAPLVGSKGAIVKCQYCDTDQIL